MYEELKLAAGSANFPRWSLNGEVCVGIAVSIYDGDTFDAVMAIPSEGDKIKRMTIRMLGYNSPEMKMPRSASDEERAKNHTHAVGARDKLWDLLGGKEKALLRIECNAWDKYGRLLARVHKVNEGSDNIHDVAYCVNDQMLLPPYPCIPYAPN